jgi:hypothetical protein
MFDVFLFNKGNVGKVDVPQKFVKEQSVNMVKCAEIYSVCIRVGSGMSKFLSERVRQQTGM